MGQTEYNDSVQKMTPKSHDVMSGIYFGHSANEQHFIKQYAHSTLIPN